LVDWKVRWENWGIEGDLTAEEKMLIDAMLKRLKDIRAFL
jgi:hypothetical protein